MRIDEMIEELQKVRSEHGNIEVMIANMDGGFDWEATGVDVDFKREKRRLTREEALEQGHDEEYVKRVYDRNHLWLDTWDKTEEKLAIIN